MTGHSYLLVEGPQDVFFIGRILEELGLQSATSADQIPAQWTPFVDKPAWERDKKQRASGQLSVPFWQIFKPACLFSDLTSVVIERVDGNRKKFGETLRATNNFIDGGLASLAGVGLLPDGDDDPAASFRSAQDALQSVQLQVPENHQQVVEGPPKTGVFVLPGAMDPGGLEQILIDCASTVYPALLHGAQQYIKGVEIDSDDYLSDDMKEMRTPQGPAKAIVGSVSSVLKPGSTIQVSLLRDRWVSASTLQVPRMMAIVQFLKALCGVP